MKPKTNLDLTEGEYLKTLPLVRQLAFKYWLEGRSSREIMKILNGMGIKCSHVTVAKWNSRTLKDIRSGKVVDNISKLVEERTLYSGKVADNILRLVEECAIDTGISDLADQHDHYLYGKPKKEGRDVESAG
jgi:hypothetical protein